MIKTTIKTNNFINAAKYYHPHLSFEALQLIIAVYHNPGISMPGLADFLDLHDSTVSRNVKKLSMYVNDKGQTDGYDLIETRPDLINRRRLGCHLTEKGKGLIERLNLAFDPPQNNADIDVLLAKERPEGPHNRKDTSARMFAEQEFYSGVAANTMGYSVKIVNSGLKIVKVLADPGVKFALQSTGDDCGISNCTSCVTDCLAKKIFRSKKPEYAVRNECGWIEFGFPVENAGNIEEVVITLFSLDSPLISMIKEYIKQG